MSAPTLGFWPDAPDSLRFDFALGPKVHGNPAIAIEFQTHDYGDGHPSYSVQQRFSRPIEPTSSSQKLEKHWKSVLENRDRCATSFGGILSTALEESWNKPVDPSQWDRIGSLQNLGAQPLLQGVARAFSTVANIDANNGVEGLTLYALPPGSFKLIPHLTQDDPLNYAHLEPTFTVPHLLAGFEQIGLFYFYFSYLAEGFLSLCDECTKY